MSCPLIDSDNPKCSASLNMQRLEEAYEFCADHYELCPVYIQWCNRMSAKPDIGDSPESTGKKRVTAIK